MKRILIFGNSGSGKSTLAKAMGAELGIETYHLDEILHDANWNRIPEDEGIAQIQDIIDKPEWIIDGPYLRIMFQQRLERADTVVLLDLPASVSVFRCINRAYGTGRFKKRVGAKEGARTTLTWKWIKWIAYGYPRKKRPEILKVLREECEHLELVVLKSKKNVRRFLESLSKGK